MAEISVKDAGGGRFDVEVVEDGTYSSHSVAVPEGYAAGLGLPEVGAAELIEESFRFLLEREPTESILSSFELDVIARYFPEYPEEIRRRLS